MKKINRRQLRRIIAESYGDMNDPYNPLADPDLVQRDMGDSTYDIDYETGIEEIPPPEEDVGEMARYHALNNDKDEMLYRDNPDYKGAYDDMTSIDEGFLGFGSDKDLEYSNQRIQQDEEAAIKRRRMIVNKKALDMLKMGQISVKDLNRVKQKLMLDLEAEEGVVRPKTSDEHLADLDASIDQMKVDLGYEAGPETKEQRMKRLLALHAKRKAARGMSESKSKEEELNQWYYGHDNNYDEKSNWYDVGGNYHELSLNELIEDQEEDED